MLELPESYFLAKQVDEYLKGKIVSKIEILHTPHRFAFFKGEVQNFPELLEGKTIQGAEQHGGMLQINTEDSEMIFSDGASLKYFEDKEDFPKTHQFAVYFDDDSALFMSIRMYAVVFVQPTGTCKDMYYLQAIEKPDPFSKEFTYEYFKGLYPKDKKMSAKAFLATEQRIPGIGNGVLQDILWDAGIDPRFDMRNCSEEQFKQLFNSVLFVLSKMKECGGRDTENDIFGNKCGYISQLSKNSYMEPCTKCGNLIHKANYMGGTIYFCENCQVR